MGKLYSHRPSIVSTNKKKDMELKSMITSSTTHSPYVLLPYTPKSSDIESNERWNQGSCISSPLHDSAMQRKYIVNQVGIESFGAKLADPAG